MSVLQSIPVRVENGGDGSQTGNLRPLLLQIEQALQDLVEKGVECTIDLGAMPFTEQDERDLRQRLGDGEVRATLDAFGPTLIEETGIRGVWLVEHQDVEQRRLTLHVEVARIPGILITPSDDLADDLEVLRESNLNLFDTPTEDVQ
jgi:hydrogenase-1 operon protein HyaF